MLRIGSRGSKLALWQSRWVAARLEELGEPCRVEIIRTTGDKITGVALSQVGTKGLFTKEIEEALLNGRIDLAVHSLKDMPTQLPSGLVLAAVPEREDARDAVVGIKLSKLCQGAKVGTSSLRRAAQLSFLRPDLEIASIRGNLDTRLRKLDDGEYDAIILAAAGLRRLGLEHRIAEPLSIEVMCPAVGQGALAIEVADEQGPVLDICRHLDHPATRAAITAERAVLDSLGGGCQVPIGSHAKLNGNQLEVSAVVASQDGGKMYRRRTNGSPENAEQLGRQLGEELLASGAQEILEEVYGTT